MSRIGTLTTLGNRELYLISLVQISESHVGKIICVEEQVLLHADSFYVPELAFKELDDLSCFHKMWGELITHRSARRRSLRLHFRDLDGVRSFRTFAYLELDGVTFAKFVECNVNEFVGMKEEILRHSFDLDEPEPFVGKARNSSLLHTY